MPCFQGLSTDLLKTSYRFLYRSDQITASCKIRDAEKAAGSLHAASSFAHYYAARAVVLNTLSSHVFEKARVGFEPTTSVDYGNLTN